MAGIAGKFLRIVRFGIAGVLLLIGVYAASLLWSNNRTVAGPDRQELAASLERAIGWLEADRERVLRSQNAALWRMVRDAAELTGDARLASLVSAYERRHIDTAPRDIWDLLIRPDPFLQAPEFYELSPLQPYQHLFIYGMTCARALADEPSIRRQLEPDFCGVSALSPRCVTHQLYGVRLLQENRCPETADLPALVSALQDRIAGELFWDPRVGDAYLQRVMMLAQTGASERIEPVWRRQIIAAQNDDGGWGDLDPIIALPGGRVLAFSSQLPKVARPRSIFHSTAQGLLAVSLLLHEEEGARAESDEAVGESN